MKYLQLLRFALATIIVLSVASCTARAGGHYLASGPHPHVTASVEGVLGPVAISHSAISNSKPADDLTTLTLAPDLGIFEIRTGLGLHRLWGACNAEGHECVKTWHAGAVAAAGLSVGPIVVRYQRYWGAPFDGALVFYLQREL